ncbi:hypothetical protein Ato02nite_032650 [Paractinoplanes toevensis]|uniref:Uncharacterized protein n=1 Tax=Paractinoplanes toevensis TaxID=571911 RepID=A0A919W0M7_9ACTN|nr:hypothetical protein Ato02nite_032650 [Actinoplanes toevensis]
MQLPLFGVLVIGLILLAVQGHRLPRRSRLMARAGLAIMLAEGAVSVLWTAFIPELLSQTGYGSDSLRVYSLATAIVGFFMSLLFAVGIGLVIGALLTARQLDRSEL